MAARTAEVQKTNRIYERFVPKQFVQLLGHEPEDKLVHLYQQRIALAIAQGVPDDWDGVERLVEK